ncbi:Acetyltransferase (GNAT) family protein [Streptomyces sp. YIM 130001]|uniref:GNAT family N-acetyltransferase n=1 Tax=Streptomyces sp. YIM 130001 TaxID=2259644 RepID=UPI000E653601|nr:GNAT family N-acetyltransferase [Streptomyces sp. YIM 130001]RII11211.1 Acetyltransferase (GNAT) family protein [Streptomyces sp. YIM 130001]
MRNYSIRTATADDAGPARAIMLDTVYHDFGTGYVPRWHGDIVDLEGAYLLPARHTLLVAVDDTDGSVVATAALDSRGPAHPPNPRWIADRFPSGETAQLRRVYVRATHRRHGIARRLVAELLDFAAADGGYRSVYLHTDPAVPGAEGFWQSLGKAVLDERAEPGGSRVVHFEVAMGAESGRPQDSRRLADRDRPGLQVPVHG